MAEVTFNPKSHYLTVSQEVVYSLMSNTVHWLTVREVSLKTGIGEATAAKALKFLVETERAQKRRRAGGFDNGVIEYKPNRSDLAERRRGQDFESKIVGFEPLERKLKRLLGLRRAREAELIFKR